MRDRLADRRRPRPARDRGGEHFRPHVGVAAPLLLVLAGIAVSFLPFVPEVEVEPEWILTVVLPPLL